MVTAAKDGRAKHKGGTQVSRAVFRHFRCKVVQNAMQTFVNLGMLLHFFVKNYLGRTTFFFKNAPSSPAFQHQLYH